MEIQDYKAPKNNIEKTISYLKRHGLKETVKKVSYKLAGKDQEHYAYQLYLKEHKLTEENLRLQSDESEQFDYRPIISIVIPLYNTKEQFLKELIESVTGQSYDNWQLCLADGSPGDKPDLAEAVSKYSNNDTRVKYKFLNENKGISGNTNAAIEMADGEYIAFCDHDDVLTKDALFEVVKALNSVDRPDIIYSDEDKMGMETGKYFLPHFKSDFNIDLLCSHNYITHLFVCKSEIVRQVGGVHSEYDGAQDHDMIFRCVELTDKIYHIPKVLYHWRCHEESTAAAPEAKMYAYDSGRRAVEDHYKRINIPAKVELDTHLGYYRTHFEWEGQPLVSIVIPNKDHVDDLKACIDSIVEKNTYPNIEFVIVENNSQSEEIFEYYKNLEIAAEMSQDENGNSVKSDDNGSDQSNNVDTEREKKKKLRYTYKVITYEGDFNFSAIVNKGVEEASGEYILLLNNDTRMIYENGIEELLGYARRPDVGAVGARLYYANNSVQHAGLVLGLGGVANSAFLGDGRDQVGYFYRSVCTQDMSAVTGACLMVSKADYEAVGGFDESLAVAFNDVDFCLKLREDGKLNVFNPFSEWYHLESVSRGYDEKDAAKQERLARETALFEEKWKGVLEAGDPYYNRNLSRRRFDYAIKEPGEAW